MSRKVRRVPVVLDAGEIKILEYKLNECPAYGYYHDMKLEDISKCIDWMIKKDYLRIKYDYRLPLLVFSEKGWKIEKETFAEELYQRFCLDIKEKNARVIFEMKDVNRQVAMLVLDKIEKDGTEEFFTCLDAWRLLEVKKVAVRIAEVENTIKNRAKLSE